MSRLFLLALLSRVGAEISTPSSLLGPRHFNHHPYEQYLKEVKPTKQGPVLFPNDAPPPPRPPLVVTSRPLIESITRSELNPGNNTIAAQSQISRVYSGRVRGYQPYQYDYEDQQPTLPPIYRAISDHANQNLQQQQKKNVYNNYKVKEPDYSRQYESNNVNDDDNNDYNQAQNYAFSYIVRDQKTGDDFSHSQHSSGSATNGEYRVRLPDGRMQIVSYTADENGYKADVRYDDEKTTGNSIDYNVNRNFNNDYTSNQNHNHDYTGNQIHNRDYTGNQNQNRDYTGNHNQNHNRDYSGNHNQNFARNQNDYINNVDYNQNYNYDYKDQANKIINDINANYVNEDTKPVVESQNKDDYQYADSKEYYGNDYSLEYDDKYNNYDPHKSKFTAFSGPKNPKFIPKKTYSTASTVRPSYEELKPLFVQTKPFKSQSNNEYLYSKIPIQISVPSTTPSPYFDSTTERVVIIGTTKPNLYTNIRSSISPISVTPIPNYSSPIVTTPRSFLASTVASIVNLKKNIDFSGAKPVLTNTFIDKINKYLSYT